jgi:3-mercaptopyruvate sulfurtransferase SseA
MSLPRFISIFMLILLSSQAQAAGHAPVSADAAANALGQGAFVIDVRSPEDYGQGHLVGAASLPQDAAQRSLYELAALLSRAGIDTSRTVIVMGDAANTNDAQALYERLSAVASGRVLWLVGGVTEWQMTGRTLTRDVMQRAPLPQVLTPFATAPSRMAGARVRSSAVLEQSQPIKVALH